MSRNTNRKVPNANQGQLSTLASRTPETLRKSMRKNDYTYQNNSESSNDCQKSSGIQIDSDEENLSSKAYGKTYLFAS